MTRGVLPPQTIETPGAAVTRLSLQTPGDVELAGELVQPHGVKTRAQTEFARAGAVRLRPEPGLPVEPFAQQHVDDMLERLPISLSEFLDPDGDVVLYGQRRAHRRTIRRVHADVNDVRRRRPRHRVAKWRGHAGTRRHRNDVDAVRLVLEPPVHNRVGTDAERPSGQIDGLPSRQSFVAEMEQMLLPPAG